VSARPPKSLLRYWSVRYFLIMFASVAIVGVSTLCFIQKEFTSNQYRKMLALAADIGAEAMKYGGRLPEQPDLARFLDERAAQHGLYSQHTMFLLDPDGNVVRQFPAASPEARLLSARLPAILTDKPHVAVLASDDGRPMVAAVQPMIRESSVVGYVLYLMPREQALSALFRLRSLRIIVVCTFLIIGWGMIYMMTRRFVRPIRKAVAAAQQIVNGNYDIRLEPAYKVREVDELMQAFKEMAGRLSRLESLRNQLLAGVTHELKTPIASFSGLVQAVREGVVVGEEADRFLDNALKQSNRMQKMVEDLLDFNRFATNEVAVRQERFGLHAVLRDIVERWRCGRPTGLEVTLEAAGEAEHRQVLSDSYRIEQIMVNLLNNAAAAIGSGGGAIRVRVEEGMEEVCVSVTDSGRGIPAEERDYVFEPFYRGEDKKKRERGLGLGLPFSRRIARSLGGELSLEASEPGETTFVLRLPVRSV